LLNTATSVVNYWQTIHDNRNTERVDLPSGSCLPDNQQSTVCQAVTATDA